MNKTVLKKTRVYLSVELLKSLNKKELEGLAYFTENKYFNTDKDLTALLKQLKKYALQKEKFTPEIQLKVYAAVFGNNSTKQKELDKKQKDYLTNKLNALLRLAEQFLMVDYMKNKPDLKFELLYPQLIDKKQTLLFNRHLKRDQKKLEQETKRGVDYHNSQYKLQVALLTYYYKEGIFTQTDNYNELQYHLDIKYLLYKLNCHLGQITLNTITAKKQYDFSSFDALESVLALPQYSKNPMVQLYLLNINLIKIRDNKTFHLLLQKLADENDTIPANFLNPFYLNVTNYCIFNIKKGKLAYHQNLFDIYQQMHEKNLLLKDNNIYIRLLKNVISASCAVNEFEWAKKILHIYKPYLSHQIQESVYNYNLGKIAFDEGSFNSAHDYLVKVEKIDNIYDINVRILILKCIFEKEEDFQEATLQSFFSAKIFFKRNKFLATSHKKGYINFVEILIELYKYKHRENEKEIDVILKKLEVMEHISNKDWLKAKIGELNTFNSSYNFKL